MALKNWQRKRIRYQEEEKGIQIIDIDYDYNSEIKCNEKLRKKIKDKYRSIS